MNSRSLIAIAVLALTDSAGCQHHSSPRVPTRAVFRMHLAPDENSGSPVEVSCAVSFTRQGELDARIRATARAAAVVLKPHLANVVVVADPNDAKALLILHGPSGHPTTREMHSGFANPNSYLLLNPGDTIETQGNVVAMVGDAVAVESGPNHAQDFTKYRCGVSSWTPEHFRNGIDGSTMDISRTEAVVLSVVSTLHSPWRIDATQP